ncbi:interferon alpha-inducible protein 27-like protein 2A isoform X2 [Mugil cephalus]|uniref:interferon alpha-inducible protein 27-like protein 2A isoform X2 n=1 Tax=Mugil cephalus TaxID=48193 RepID=UPI001FB58D5F|nr:interferon alpha-inducible protein 27-like protein 2A isoform X2 [Mugil cephalus]
MDLDIDLEEICKLVVIGAGGVVTVAATPAALAGMGFTATGIAAGSIAAKLMSYLAIMGGGGVAAGGFFATLQSIAMGGLSWLSAGFLGGAGSTAGWVLSRICNGTRTD